MRKTLAYLIAIILLRPMPLVAAEQPEDFLAELVASDFAGNSLPRRHNVFYTDGKTLVGLEEGGCDCGGEPRENFYTDSGPLIVVSRWQVVDTRMEAPAKAAVTVSYHVLATTEGREWDRKILPLPTPRNEEVTYRVWQDQGRWLWVDPPEVPWVGRDAVIASLRTLIADLEEVVRKTSDRPDLPGKIALYTKELEFLEALPPPHDGDRHPARVPSGTQHGSPKAR